MIFTFFNFQNLLLKIKLKNKSKYFVKEKIFKNNMKIIIIFHYFLMLFTYFGYTILFLEQKL